MAKKPKVRIPKFPLLENCNTEIPEEFALWALVGLPGQNGAPLPMPVGSLRSVSKRLWDLGFRYHPELRTLKYKRPRGSEPNWMTSPGTWVSIDEPDDAPETPEEIAKKLSPERKALLRKQFGLDEAPPAPVVEDDMVPFLRADGTTVTMTRAEATRWFNARKAARESGGDLE